MSDGKVIENSRSPYFDLLSSVLLKTTVVSLLLWFLSDSEGPNPVNQYYENIFELNQML